MVYTRTYGRAILYFTIVVRTASSSRNTISNLKAFEIRSGCLTMTTLEDPDTSPALLGGWLRARVTRANEEQAKTLTACTEEKRGKRKPKGTNGLYDAVLLNEREAPPKQTRAGEKS